MFFCICYIFLLTVFLCFYCTHAVTDDVEKERKREKEHEAEKNKTKKDLFIF